MLTAMSVNKMVMLGLDSVSGDASTTGGLHVN